MSVLIFFIILFVLVLVHEYGHFVVAKFFKIRVDEFGIGFPPRAVKLFHYKGTDYTLNWIPFGGFVKIFGENPDDESLYGPDKEKALIAKPRWIQALVLVAGVTFNFILTWILLSIGFMSGLPTSQIADPEVTNAKLTITEVINDSPAEAAGFRPGMIVNSISFGDEVAENLTPKSFQEFVSSHDEDKIAVSYTLQGEEKVIEVIPKSGVIGTTPGIGVSIDMIGIKKLPVLSAIGSAFIYTAKLTWVIASSLASLIAGAFHGNADFSQISGPVGIVGIVGDAAKFGFIYLLSLTAVISLNLTIINLLPFPALDGGRLLFLLIEAIKRKRINPKVTNALNTIGFSILILLMVLVTVHDVIRLI